MQKAKKEIYNHDFLKEKIKEYIDYYKLTMGDFAIRIGMTEETFKKTLNNERVFFANEINIIKDELALNTDEMMKAFFTIDESNKKGGTND